MLCEIPTQSHVTHLVADAGLGNEWQTHCDRPHALPGPGSSRWEEQPSPEAAHVAAAADVGDGPYEAAVQQ